jgi:predicted transcriptional regulator
MVYVRIFANMKFKNLHLHSPTKEHEQLALIAKAVSHPVRLYVLNFLSKQACCYSGNLTELLPIAKSTLSQHLKELKKAGLIKGELQTPRIKYCINQENWALAQKLFKEFFES